MIDHCPYCRQPLKKEVTDTVEKGMCRIGGCMNCGHLIICQHAKEPGHNEFLTIPYKWLHESHDETELQVLRDMQEEFHHTKGHWG